MDLIKITSRLHNEINGELATGEKFVAKFIDGVAEVTRDVFDHLRGISDATEVIEEKTVDPPLTEEELAKLSPQQRAAITKRKQKEAELEAQKKAEEDAALAVARKAEEDAAALAQQNANQQVITTGQPEGGVE